MINLHIMKEIAPVILAAGDSSRMGYPKAILPLRNDTFVGRILSTLTRAGLTAPRIVLGRDAGRITPGIADQRIRPLINPNPEQGQLSSMKLALKDLEQDCVACLFWPVDQPGIKEEVVRRLVQLFRDSGALIALPTYKGRRGHPAIFGRGIFQELLQTPIEAGPKDLVRRHAAQTALLPCNEPGVVEDIDTPEEYFRFTGETLKDALRRTLAVP